MPGTKPATTRDLMWVVCAATAIIVLVSRYDMSRVISRFDRVEHALQERGKWMEQVNERLSIPPSGDDFVLYRPLSAKHFVKESK